MDKRRRWRTILIAAFVVALVITSVFAFRVTRRITDFRRSGEVAQIVPWMNVPHVARVHRVPPEILYQALELPPGDNRPLGAIARVHNLDVTALISQLQQAIDEYRTNHASPPPDAPRPPNPSERRP
jgi:hypothetical protein